MELPIAVKSLPGNWNLRIVEYYSLSHDFWVATSRLPKKLESFNTIYLWQSRYLIFLRHWLPDWSKPLIFCLPNDIVLVIVASLDVWQLVSAPVPIYIVGCARENQQCARRFRKSICIKCTPNNMNRDVGAYQLSYHLRCSDCKNKSSDQNIGCLLQSSNQHLRKMSEL